MRAQLLHLNGPYRGRTMVYPAKTVLFGTAPDAHVCYPADGVVEERHAALAFLEEGCAFHLKAIDGSVFVNHQEIREVILEPGDLLEIGRGGPKVRFRVQAEGGRSCKPVHLMLHDAREVGAEAGLAASAKSLCRDLCTQASWKLRVGVPLLVIVVALGAASLGGLLGSARTAVEQDALREGQTAAYQTEIARIRAQVEASRREQAGGVTRQEIDELRAELASRATIVDKLVERNAALAKVLDVYSRGVCLLHGSFTLKVPQQGALVPLTGPDGDPLEMEYLGSGFLASTRGHVMTNRHIAEPWWNNAAVAPLLQQGAVPEFVHLTATFPGMQPITVDPATVRISRDGVDVAILIVNMEGDVPVLPLFSGEARALRGDRVVLLGYPTGLNALLARAEPNVAAEALAAASDTATLIRELADREVISPVITQGALNEVKEKRLVYDAETTSGGSGGPVFGPDGTVIGINFAMTRDFDGSNFGVPIRFARKLLPQEGSDPHASHASETHDAHHIRRH